MGVLVDVIIPTFNQPQMLMAALNSFNLSLFGAGREMVHFHIVNNGHPDLEKYIQSGPSVTLHQTGGNLGWEGGLKYGLARSKAPFVIFANDDIRLLTGQKDWLWKMVSMFNDPSVGAVGPSSNYVMGPQNIFADLEDKTLEVKFLIGFFMLVRREALEKAGGVDDTLPGGDDIDLSIRLRDAAYRLVARRDVFVFHHGSVTGNATQAGYWNSPVMQERTNQAIIKKHGMAKFFDTMIVGWRSARSYAPWMYGSQDTEGDLCRQHVSGDKILELGCGGRKTVEKAVGIDLHKAGDTIPHVTAGNESCQSDLVGDVSLELPVPSESQDTLIARHVLEHCQDPIGTLYGWNKALKSKGTLIVAVPNHKLGNTIMMNPEHVVSFTPASLRNAAAVCGFREKHVYEDVNGVSFVSIFEKEGEPSYLIKPAEATVSPKAARLEEEVKEGLCGV